MNSCRMFGLAASISLALASTAAFAAPPAATQLPGQGAIDPHSPTATTGPVAINAGTSTMTVPLTGNTVIDWGASGGTINSAGTAGFNIGQSATVDFTGNYGVLNIDVSGNPSQIYGTLSGAGGVFVANANGIIVGPNASIASTGGAVGLIANTLGANQSGFDGTPGSVVYDTTGGNVTVMTGAALGGSSVLVSGGGIVNVDVGAFTGGDITLRAGENGGTPTPATPVGAGLVVSGNNNGPNVGALILQSANNASSSGAVSLGAGNAVEGTLTNTGSMFLFDGLTLDGSLVNTGSITGMGVVAVHGFNNSGNFNEGGSGLLVTGNLNNSGQLTDSGDFDVNGGDLVNGGTIESSGSVVVDGGNLVNDGNLTTISEVYAVNGSIVNNGTITDPGGIETSSNPAEASFVAGADYSITNHGTLSSSSNGLFIEANDGQINGYAGSGSGNSSTGSFINTGIMDLGLAVAVPLLQINANNGIQLGGQVQVGGTAISASNPASAVVLQSTSAAGLVTVATPLFANGQVPTVGDAIDLTGNQVAIAANVGGTGIVRITAGNKPASYTGSSPATDYAVRIGNGVTVSAGAVVVQGLDAGTGPNVILQGTVSGNSVDFTGSDLYSGPHGRIVATGATPTVTLNFTGAIKTVPYNNDPDNFRFNDLPIVDRGTSPLALALNPVAFQTNGTSNGLSAVNILVDGSVGISQSATAADGFTPTPPNGTATTGAVDLPNTHLVLQASGNITTAGAFYWPGYVYLGTIASDASGNPLAGTLSTSGTINLGGDFNNVLPGDVAGASGIHFITNVPLVMATGADVVTNANAWINFGTDALTTQYRNANGASGPFFGGTANGNVVTYGPLGPSSFVTQPPNPNR